MKKGLIASLIVLASLAVSATGVASGLALYRSTLQSEVVGEKGEKGDTGEQGEKGDKGDTGAQGEEGKTAWSNTILPIVDGGYVTSNSGSSLVGETVVFTYHPKAAETLQFRVLDKDGNQVEDQDQDEKTFTTTMKEGGFVVEGFVGSTNNPYKIDEQKDFTFIAKHSSENKVMEVEKDFTIDLNDYALDSGNVVTPFEDFQGTLDGHGYTVKLIGKDTGSYGSLIKNAKAGSSIKNLKLDVANKDGSHANFGLVFSSNGNLTVSNVEISGKIKWNNQYGGIVLFQSNTVDSGDNNIVFDNVKIDADISSSSNLGVFVGSPVIQAAYTFKNCTFDSVVNAPSAYLLFGNAYNWMLNVDKLTIDNFTLGEKAMLNGFKSQPSLLTSNDGNVFGGHAEKKAELLKAFVGKEENKVLSDDNYGFTYSLDPNTKEFMVNPLPENKINGVEIDHYTFSMIESVRIVAPSSKSFIWSSVPIQSVSPIKAEAGKAVGTGYFDLPLSNFESDRTKGEEYLNDGYDTTQGSGKDLKEALEKTGNFVSDDLRKDATPLPEANRIGLIKDEKGNPEAYVFLDSKQSDEYPLILNLGKNFGWSVSISAFDADGNLLSIATKK